MHSPHNGSATTAIRAPCYTADQLLLRQFHAGVRARQLRHQHGVDPWDVVSRHRNLPVAQYHEVAAILNVAGVQG